MASSLVPSIILILCTDVDRQFLRGTLCGSLSLIITGKSGTATVLFEAQSVLVYTRPSLPSSQHTPSTYSQWTPQRTAPWSEHLHLTSGTSPASCSLLFPSISFFFLVGPGFELRASCSKAGPLQLETYLQSIWVWFF
jgi:hypothetical protein